MFSGLNIIFPDQNRPFESRYKCFSVSMLPGNERQDLEKGGKIIMPPSALDQLTRLNIEYPMLFKLKNEKKERITHAGVLEFVADEGKVYLPYWMMRNLLLEEGDFIHIENVSLPVATYSKFQPQSSDFLDITNPKAVLENALRNFACLTSGDSIAIIYNQRIYELCVLETKPRNAVSIIECDMNVEFEAPVGYTEPTPEPKIEEVIEPIINNPKNMATTFFGEGVRLDGKQKKIEDKPIQIQKNSGPQQILPNYNYEMNVISFDRTIIPISDRIPVEKPEPKEENDNFGTVGHSLRKDRKTQ